MSDIDNVSSRIRMPFRDHFYGNGKTVTIDIDRGLFANIAGGSIDGLTIEANPTNFSAFFNSDNMGGTISNCTINISYFGAITGFNHGGIIINCVNNGHLTGADRIGGIACNNEGHIISCLNTGKITATNSTGTGIFSGVGGVCGTAISMREITNCINIGNVEGQ